MTNLVGQLLTALLATGCFSPHKIPFPRGRSLLNFCFECDPRRVARRLIKSSNWRQLAVEDRGTGCETPQNPVRFRVSLNGDLDWATKILSRARQCGRRRLRAGCELARQFADAWFEKSALAAICRGDRSTADPRSGIKNAPW
jgi:hypothetical protein